MLGVIGLLRCVHQEMHDLDLPASATTFSFGCCQSPVIETQAEYPICIKLVVPQVAIATNRASNQLETILHGKVLLFSVSHIQHISFITEASN